MLAKELLEVVSKLTGTFGELKMGYYLPSTARVYNDEFELKIDTETNVCVATFRGNQATSTDLNSFVDQLIGCKVFEMPGLVSARQYCKEREGVKINVLDTERVQFTHNDKVLLTCHIDDVEPIFESNITYFISKHAHLAPELKYVVTDKIVRHTIVQGMLKESSGHSNGCIITFVDKDIDVSIEFGEYQIEIIINDNVTHVPYNKLSKFDKDTARNYFTSTDCKYWLRGILYLITSGNVRRHEMSYHIEDRLTSSYITTFLLLDDVFYLEDIIEKVLYIKN